jgi:hypothetical protein
MHVRRALLLFAIVLGLAAIATAVSQPPARKDRNGAGGQPPTQPEPRTLRPRHEGARPTRVGFTSSSRARVRRLEAGQPAEVTVAVDRPGQVELDGLGLSAPAEPLTPARFEVLAPRATRADVLFVPAGAAASRRIGVLAIEPPVR